MRAHRRVYFGVVFLLCFHHLCAIRWLSLQRSKLKWNLDEGGSGRGTRSGFRSPCSVARRLFGLAKFQAKLCRSSVEIMPHVQQAALLAARSCKSAFQFRRWNCSSIDTAPHLTPDLTRATREQAFVYAVGSAALVHTMARACSTGSIAHCTCADPTGTLPGGADFQWGGCADNVLWGAKFAKRFIDSAERHRRKSLPDRKPKSFVSAMNLHNNRVGRKVITEHLTLQCKCHGVSGSCSVKTCWKSIPSVQQIGQLLLDRFTVAKEISKNSLVSATRPDYRDPYEALESLASNEQLVFLSKSPDYCTKDLRLGSFGTTGRQCNVTSNGTESCRRLCCGRGYRTVVEEKVERCHCKYHYCCYVTCKTCKSVIQRYECS